MMSQLKDICHKYRFFIAAGSLFLFYHVANDEMARIHSQVSSEPIIGVGDQPVTGSKLNETTSLPIMRVRAKTDDRTADEIDVDLFAVAKKEELPEEPLPVVLEVAPKIEEDYTLAAVDFFKGLDVTAILDAGAVIDNSFTYRHEQLVTQYVAPDGEVFTAKLISLRSNRVVLSVKDKELEISL